MIVKNTLAPQKKITIDIPSGMTDHAISSATPPVAAFGTGSESALRRYLIAKIDHQPGDQHGEEHADSDQEEIQRVHLTATAEAASGNNGSEKRIS